MAHSTKSQEENFYDFMDDIRSVWYTREDVDMNPFLERIHKAFENGDITSSQYDKLVRECDELT